MALSLTINTDASIASTNVDLDDAFVVGLDEGRTFVAYDADAAGTVSRKFAVLSHPAGGSGSWGTPVDITTGETFRTACLLDTDKVLLIVVKAPAVGLMTEFYAQVASVSGTTITLGTAYRFGADIPWEQGGSSSLVALSPSRALLSTSGGGNLGADHFVILNMSGTTLSSSAVVYPRLNTNLITDDTNGLEGGLGKWETADADTTISRSNAQARSGSWSLQIDQDGTTSTEAQTGSGTNGYPVTVGKRYKPAFFGRANATGSGSDQLSLYIKWYDSGGTLLSTSNVITDLRQPPNGYWQQWYGPSAVAPASAAYASVRVFTTDIANTYTLHVDDTELWDATDDPHAQIRLVALDASTVLAIYGTEADSQKLVAAVLTVTSTAVSFGTPTTLKTAAGVLNDVAADRLNDGRWLVAARLGSTTRHFLLTVSGTSITSSEDATTQSTPDISDWALILDRQFVVYVDVTVSAAAGQIRAVREYTTSIGSSLGSPALPTRAQAGRATFYGQRRMMIVGPRDPVTGELRGVEFTISGLPALTDLVGMVG